MWRLLQLRVYVLSLPLQFTLGCACGGWIWEKVFRLSCMLTAEVRRKLQKNSTDYIPKSLPITQTSVKRVMSKNKEKEQRKPPHCCADESTCFNVLVQTDPSLRKSLLLMSTAIYSTTTEFCNFRNIKVAPVHTEVAAVTKNISRTEGYKFVSGQWISTSKIQTLFL